MSMGTTTWLHLFFLVAVLLGGCSWPAEQIPLGSKLSASENQVWVSDNRTFAFGFTMTGLRNDEFQLAIWYARLPGNQTIVWSANRNSPVGRDAVVELDTTGNLVLIDRKTSIWMSNTSAQGVETAVMSDSGNLILFNNTLHPLWQTFSHPSDTLLPGQPLTVNLELTSARSPSNGCYYSLKMLQQPTSLCLGLTYNSPESYLTSPESHTNYTYWSGPDISNATGDIVALLDNSGNFGIVYGDSPAGVVYLYQSYGRETSKTGNRSVLRRLAIEANGNLRLYRWDDTIESQQWTADWAAVSNLCTIAGICGNGICNLDGSKTNASCTCPPGTSSSGHSKECVANSLPPPGNCNSSSSLGKENSTSSGFDIVTVPQTKYYFAGSSVISNYGDISVSSRCRESCQSDCNCVASVYGLSEETTYCWTLRSMVFGGLPDPGSTLFVKIGINSTAKTPRGGPVEGSEGGKEKVLVLPLVLSISLLIALLCALLYYSVHRRRSLRRAINGSLTVPGAPLNFTFRELHSATCNFSQKLGNGGFGSVYKGSLGDGTLVAVKKLERALPHGEKEFIAEVTTIGSMHHVNLVRLCGFCTEGSHRLLVYEFMRNGSLDKWIFPSHNNHNRLLDWETRFRVAIGTAQGIAYFHEQCRDRIIHCDIKPENILLDENFCPKVSDFGLAKLMGRETSHVVTMVRGTRGYLAPEWVSNRPITVKADVYSYGMLLLEIIGGRRNLDMSLDAEDFFYPGWAYKEMTKGMIAKVADKRLKGELDERELVRAVSVAFWCIQEELWMRPSMGQVVKMLEGSVDIKVPPIPQTVLELVEEGLDHVYKAMKRDFTHSASFTINTHPSSRATCSYSTMSPR